jgi:hypothetical protein
LSSPVVRYAVVKTHGRPYRALVTRRDLLERALEACGGDEAQLAQRLGMKNVNSAAREFQRWRKGTGMNYERTVALLRIAGLLREEPSFTSPSEEELVQVLSAVSGFLERLALASHGPAPPRPATENGA